MPCYSSNLAVRQTALIATGWRSLRHSSIWRLESYEDALKQPRDARCTEKQQLLLDATEAQGADGFREQYILRYMLDVETRGSQSLLNVQAFTDPAAYQTQGQAPRFGREPRGRRRSA